MPASAFWNRNRSHHGVLLLVTILVLVMLLCVPVQADWTTPQIVGSFGSAAGTGDIKINASGYVYYIAGNNVDEYSPTGTLVNTIMGNNNWRSSDGSPHGLAINSSGYLFVALNSGGSSPSGSFAYFAPQGTSMLNQASDGTEPPFALTANASDYLYEFQLNPTSSANNGVTAFDSRAFTQFYNPRAFSWGGGGSDNGKFGALSSSVLFPAGIAVNSSGYVYVSDPVNQRVQVFDPSGNYITKWGSAGTGNGQFGSLSPRALAIDPNDNVYVVDFAGGRTEAFDPSGNYLTDWTTITGSNGNINMVPFGIAVNSSGYIFITGCSDISSSYNEILILSPFTSTSTLLTGIGATTGTTHVGDILTNGTVTPAGATVLMQWNESANINGPYIPISGATGFIYVLQSSDLGKYIEANATGTGSYSGFVNSTPAGPVTTPLTGIGPITGTAEVGQNLNAGTATPSSASYTRQWNESTNINGPYTPLAGATGSTYSLATSDIGKYLEVNATGTGFYTGFANSTPFGPVLAPCTLNYNGNGYTGGTVPSDSHSPYTSGSTVTVLGNGTMTNSSSIFSGWNTRPDDGGTNYVQGNTFAISSATTLYANWTPTYAIIYNGNTNTGGSAPTDSHSPYASGSTVTVLGNTGSLTKTGYAFNNWNTATDGSGTRYSAGATFSIGSNVVLYANWTPAYTINYDGNTNTGGSAPTDTNSPYASGSTVTVLGNTGSLTKTGYAFNDWNTATDGSGTSYSPGSTFVITSAATLYANWTIPSGSGASGIVTTTVPTTAIPTPTGTVEVYGGNTSGVYVSGGETNVTVPVGGSTPVTSVTVEGTGLKDLVVTSAAAPGPGTGVSVPPGTVIGYFDVTPARYTSISDGEISFMVAQSWLSLHHFTPQDIVMYHNTTAGWQALPTTFDNLANGEAVFTATTPGFSVFAITAQPGGSAGVAPSPTVLTYGELAGASQTGTPVPVAPGVSPAQSVPAAATTTPRTGLDALPVLCALVLCSGILLFRRWE